MLHFRKCVAWSEQALSISVRMFKLLSPRRYCSKSHDPPHLPRQIADDKQLIPISHWVKARASPHDNCRSAPVIYLWRIFGDIYKWWSVTISSLKPLFSHLLIGLIHSKLSLSYNTFTKKTEVKVPILRNDILVANVKKIEQIDSNFVICPFVLWNKGFGGIVIRERLRVTFQSSTTCHMCVHTLFLTQYL